ncbi:MAG TPA: GTPase [Hyphomicrobiaceae bacterium]|nr:GTPase [Hyphomicrobiaceae bacterium]
MDAVGETSAEEAEETIARRARAWAPVVWLLGKVQSGKTSIVRTITASTDAEVGDGFKACTHTARVFEFPAEAPAIRFLDTRGLGEVAYDPSEDMAFCERQAHLVVLVMKALDHQQQVVVAALEKVRKRHPDWPVVVAQTALHEGYRLGQGHPDPYPFDQEGHYRGPPQALPADLLRALAHQRALLSRIPGPGPILFVPIDFTHESDDFTPANYGLKPFMDALQRVAPSALGASLREMREGQGKERAGNAHPYILGCAAAAAAADLVPVAGAIAVPGVQATMLRSLGLIYGTRWDRRTLAEFAGALGAGIAVRLLSGFGIRQLVKLVPVYGQTAGAAAAAATSFATTYALGKAVCFFLEHREAGSIDATAVQRVYAENLSKAFALAGQRETARTSGP